jgi:hypothetical protein
LWLKSTAKFAEAECDECNACDNSNRMSRPRLIEGITAFMALIDLLESGSEVSKVTEVSKIRSELKELKLAVFTNASTSTTVCAVTQDTQDVLDRPNIGLDAIHKMAKEQNPAHGTTATLNAVEDTPLPPPYHGQGREGCHSHEREEGEAKAHESVLDHIFVARDLKATLAVPSDSTTDQYPVVAAVKVNKVTPTLKIMKRWNFIGLERPALLQALDAWPSRGLGTRTRSWTSSQGGSTTAWTRPPP